MDTVPVMTTKVDGAALRRLREERGIGATQLANQAGIDRKLLNKLEVGRLAGSPMTRYKVAQALGVDLGAFTYQVPSQRVAKQAA